MTVALLYCSSSPFCAAPKRGTRITPSKLLPLFSQGCSVDFGHRAGWGKCIRNTTWRPGKRQKASPRHAHPSGALRCGTVPTGFQEQEYMSIEASQWGHFRGFAGTLGERCFCFQHKWGSRPWNPQSS